MTARRNSYDHHSSWVNSWLDRVKKKHSLDPQEEGVLREIFGLVGTSADRNVGYALEHETDPERLDAVKKYQAVLLTNEPSDDTCDHINKYVEAVLIEQIHLLNSGATAKTGNHEELIKRIKREYASRIGAAIFGPDRLGQTEQEIEHFRQLPRTIVEGLGGVVDEIAGEIARITGQKPAEAPVALTITGSSIETAEGFQRRYSVADEQTYFISNEMILDGSALAKRIQDLEKDPSLTPEEIEHRRQQLLFGHHYRSKSSTSGIHLDGTMISELDVAELSFEGIREALKSIADPQEREQIANELMKRFKSRIRDVFWKHSSDAYLERIPKHPKYAEAYERYVRRQGWNVADLEKPEFAAQREDAVRAVFDGYSYEEDGKTHVFEGFLDSAGYGAKNGYHSLEDFEHSGRMTIRPSRSENEAIEERIELRSAIWQPPLPEYRKRVEERMLLIAPEDQRNKIVQNLNDYEARSTPHQAGAQIDEPEHAQAVDHPHAQRKQKTHTSQRRR